MNEISIRSTLILCIMAILSIACLLIVENTKHEQKEEWFAEKIEASRLALAAHKYIKSIRYKQLQISNVKQIITQKKAYNKTDLNN